MKCEDFRLYLDNYEALTAEKKAEMEKHASECSECRAELDFFLAIIASAKSLPPIEPPSDFMDKLNARIDSEEKNMSAAKRAARHLRKNRIQYTTAAACFALIAVLTANRGIFMDNLTDNKSDEGIISEDTVTTDTDKNNTGGNSPVATQVPADTAKADNSIAAEKSDSNKSSAAVMTETPKPDIKTALSGGNTSSGTSKQSGSSSSARTSRQTGASSVSSGSGARNSNTTLNATSAGQSTQSASNTPTTAPVETSSVQTQSTDASQTETAGLQMNKDGDYGIALGSNIQSISNEVASVAYDIRPEDVSASLKASEIKDSYSLTDDGERIAYGRYYIMDEDGNPVNEKTEPDAIGSLKIASADAEKAMNVISQYPHGEDGGLYSIDAATLSRMLSELSNEGISYTDYTLGGSDSVKFRIVFN